MELKFYIGNKLKKYRDSMGLSQEQLANKLDTTKQTISRYEKGERKIDQDTLFQLANLFNVSLDDFFPPINASVAESQSKYNTSILNEYNYFPTTISAGLPIGVDGITESQKITIPAKIMGKWANHKDVFIVKVNGESMNKVIPDGSLIAVKPVELHELKNNDIVVFSDNGDYSIKKFFHDKNNERVIFRPDSTYNNFYDYIVPYEVAKNLKIHGKVVIYIVELD